MQAKSVLMCLVILNTKINHAKNKCFENYNILSTESNFFRKSLIFEEKNV